MEYIEINDTRHSYLVTLLTPQAARDSTQISNSRAYRRSMMQYACLGQHLQLQLLPTDTRSAAVSGLLEGAKSRLGSLGATTPHLGPCAALGWGDAWEIPSWRG